MGYLFQDPEQNFLKKVLVIVGLNYGIKYQKISEIRHLITCFAKIFLPRPPNY